MIRFQACAGVLALTLAMSGCSAPQPAPVEPRKPDVLLITVDTLRADRLGVYGYDVPTSPNIDRLASRGVRFADTSAQWPKTWPSMASMLTGAYPKTIGVNYRSRTLHPTLLLLGEVFQKEGYRTAAVVANVNVGARFGFNQGFDEFVESWRESWSREAGDAPFKQQRPGDVKRFTNARIVTDHGLRWLEQSDPDKPFFLWLHYIDPHGPYLPPAEYEEYFKDVDYPSAELPRSKVARYQVQFDPATRQPISDLAHYLAQYDREVRFLDDEIGRLLGELEEDTLVAFSADHGESFNEHDYWLEHGKLSYQPTAALPLIFAQGDRLAGGRVVETPVGLIDVPATLLEIAGIEIPPTFEGDSLVGLIDGDEAAWAPPHVFMESGYHDATQLTVRQAGWKLIRVRADEDRAAMGGVEFELYDLDADPGELTNLAAERPDVVERLSAVLDAWYTGGPRPRVKSGELDLDSLTPEELEQLRSLGYVQ
jgi:arylsulfatase A-like enzyme